MSKGFTLLELLVVMAIVGILTVLSVANFMSARERAKDAQRKSDLKQIQNALELYKMDQNPVAYPADGSFLVPPNSCWSSGGSDCTGNVYMNKTPDEQYFYERSTELEYTLAACLDNEADKEASPPDDCSAYSCPENGVCYVLHQP